MKNHHIPMSFFAIMPLIFIGANLYVFWRLWHLIPSSTPALRVVVLIVGIALSVSFFVGMAARSGGVPMWLASLLYRIGSAWIFIFFYLFLALLIGDLLRLVHLLPKGAMLGNWLTLSTIASILTVIFVIGNITYHNKRRVEFALEADIMRPMKIVAVSDLHLGLGIGRKELARWVDMINREKPDAVLIAGDAIDNSTRPLWQLDFAAELRRFDASYGVFAVPGNHEYISGIDESMRFLEHAGVKVLRDSTATFMGNLVIIGRDDLSGGKRKTIAELTEGIFDDQTKIVLDHQPLHLEEAAEAGIDLQISGHTHRGQLWPATWVTDRMFECSHGEYRKGSTRYYVSQGLGIWGGKFRIGSRSEYIVIEVLPTGGAE
jgi:predicted MPP superfamily phosphohydrolase